MRRGSEEVQKGSMFRFLMGFEGGDGFWRVCQGGLDGRWKGFGGLSMVLKEGYSKRMSDGVYMCVTKVLQWFSRGSGGFRTGNANERKLKYSELWSPGGARESI